MTSVAVHASRMKKRKWKLLLLALPLMVLVVLFHYVPLFGWFISFIEYKPGYKLLDNAFVGFKYFRMILTNRDIFNALTNTLILSSISFCLLPLPMIFAILLNEIESTRYRRLVQTITTLPHFISWIIVYSLSFAMFSSDGMVNQVLRMLSMKPQSVLTDRNAVYWFQTVMSQWKGLGWGAILYIAAIAGIDQELYEAAAIDGAGRLRCALHITVPGLMPTFLVLMLLGISGLINSGFDQYYVFKNSIIYKRIEVLELYTYRVGMQIGDYSFATAVGILKSIVSVTLLFTANRFARKIRGVPIV